MSTITLSFVLLCKVARTLHILGRSLRACEKYDHAIRALQSAFKLYREILGQMPKSIPSSVDKY